MGAPRNGGRKEIKDECKGGPKTCVKCDASPTTNIDITRFAQKRNVKGMTFMATSKITVHQIMTFISSLRKREKLI